MLNGKRREGKVNKQRAEEVFIFVTGYFDVMRLLSVTTLCDWLAICLKTPVTMRRPFPKEVTGLLFGLARNRSISRHNENRKQQSAETTLETHCSLIQLVSPTVCGLVHPGQQTQWVFETE